LPSGERTPLREIAREACRFVTLREWSDTLVRDDPLPGLIDLARIAGRLGRNPRPGPAAAALAGLTGRVGGQDVDGGSSDPPSRVTNFDHTAWNRMGKGACPGKRD
jgi:hypothetical protein